MGLFDLFRKKPTPPSLSAADQALLEAATVAPGIQLPKALVPYWPQIEKTRLDCIRIKAITGEEPALEQSKFGHYPYLPAHFDYPTDAAGQYMFPLAQLNFREMPPLPGYPTSGYLQFYISAFDDLHGMDNTHPQEQANFKVLFFEENEIDTYRADFSFLDEVMAEEMVPVWKPHILRFEAKQDFIGEGDIRASKNKFISLDETINQFPRIARELETLTTPVFERLGHKIGGYASFAQWDPRKEGTPEENYILLLQIDSDEEIMWGDSGIANFFIDPADLADKNFSRVLYNWDCY